ncbi:melanoma antigen recognized by T-cells 1 isoform X2 [Phacochoerus africanus]|uniref:melanoma antigen recognized by T-cells 1 isoform X2 n=1 Tax=Phacochoerus africanus TaxID=41426 RepID=UPI001FD8BE66|nr:melanoma antigen recognized by T-cells 1 isoform X2 [Phacochoerus africanus]
MPREEAHFFYGSSKKGHGHSHITAEDCWYCKRRSGYRSLKDKSIHDDTKSTLTRRCSHEGIGYQDSKLSFQENNCGPVVPNAPPAYEKFSTEQSPPPYFP